MSPNPIQIQNTWSIASRIANSAKPATPMAQSPHDRPEDELASAAEQVAASRHAVEDEVRQPRLPTSPRRPNAQTSLPKNANENGRRARQRAKNPATMRRRSTAAGA